MEGLEGVERFVMVRKVVERLCWRQINVAICGDKKKSKSILGFSFLSPFFTITNYYFLTPALPSLWCDYIVSTIDDVKGLVFCVFYFLCFRLFVLFLFQVYKLHG